MRMCTESWHNSAMAWLSCQYCWDWLCRKTKRGSYDVGGSGHIYSKLAQFCRPVPPLVNEDLVSCNAERAMTIGPSRRTQSFFAEDFVFGAILQVRPLYSVLTWLLKASLPLSRGMSVCMVHRARSTTDTVTSPAGPELCSRKSSVVDFFFSSLRWRRSATGRAVSTTTAQGTPQTGRRP